MVLYVLACMVLTGMQKYTDIDPEVGFSTGLRDASGCDGFATVIAVGAIIGILTVMFTFMLGASRIWFAMSRDGLLPQWFAKTNRAPGTCRPGSPGSSGSCSALIGGFTPIAEAAELTNIGILLAFIVVSTAVVVLRYTASPDLRADFRCPWMPVVPARRDRVFSISLMNPESTPARLSRPATSRRERCG